MSKEESNLRGSVNAVNRLINHCGNCVFPVGTTKLPVEYQGIKLTSLRGVNLCPRCSSPEFMTEQIGYTTSNGYNDAEYTKK